MAHWRNRESVTQILTRLPPALREAAQSALEEATTELVAAMKRACPTAPDLERYAGELQDSIHAYDGHRAHKGGTERTTLLKTVTADAKDKRGDFYGPHVEYGHVARDGRHVPAHPFFWPTWRALRAGLKRRMAAKGRAAAKAIAGDMAR
jgi:hypothetical protein